MTGVFTLGESMGLVRGDGIGGFEHLATARIDSGGAEGNVAIGLARLGAPSTWLGRVGDDAFGRRVVGDLRSEGVTVRAIIDPDAATGLMLKSSPRSGTTVVDYHRRGSAGSRLQPGDLDGAGVEAHDILHVTGITLGLSTTARAAVFDAIDRAKGAGALVSFAVNHRAKIWSAAEAVAHYLRVAAQADILFASEDEARMLMPDVAAAAHSDAPALAHGLAALGAAESIVTRGSLGAIAVIEGEPIEVDAVPVPVADTVGAGDAFAAGYLAERLAGASPAQRLRTAALAGAFACTHPGDWQGLPRRADLDSIHGSDPVVR